MRQTLLRESAVEEGAPWKLVRGTLEADERYAAVAADRDRQKLYKKHQLAVRFHKQVLLLTTTSQTLRS